MTTPVSLLFSQPVLFLEQEGIPVNVVSLKFRAQRRPNNEEEIKATLAYLSRQGYSLTYDSQVDIKTLVVPSSILSRKPYKSKMDNPANLDPRSLPFVGYFVGLIDCHTSEVLSSGVSIWTSSMNEKEYPRTRVLAEAFSLMVTTASYYTGESITLSRQDRMLIAKAIGLQPSSTAQMRLMLSDMKSRTKKAFQESQKKFDELVQVQVFGETASKSFVPN